MRALRPPDTPGPGQPPAPDQWGVEAIRNQLADLDFPLTRDELTERVAQWNVPMPGETSVPLGRLLERVEDQRFDSPDAVARSVARAWPRLRNPGPW